MSEAPKKQTFLHGAALLAMATAIVKVIGALYKIPLKMVIGDQGYSYFCTAYDIYSVLLMISTAGLPVAMSRLISEASALKNYRQVRKIYKTCWGIYLGLGLVSSLLMTFFCHQLAGFQKQPDAWAAIAALGPCALLVCILSSYRGFFQGQGNMIPTSVSQVLEAVCKLIVGLVCAFAIMHYTGSVALAAGGAILGVTFSCLVSVVYMSAGFRKAYRSLPEDAGKETSSGHIAKRLLAIAVPITIGSAGLQMLTVLETNLYMGQLLGHSGMTQDLAENMKGVYNMTQTVFNMPCAFIVPITVSVIPAITSHLTLCNDKGVKETEESAARITGLISLPCAVGLTVLAKPIMSLLGGYSGEKLELAAQLMMLLGISVFLYAVVQLTNAVMQAHGNAHLPVVHMLIAGVMKLIIVYILVGNPAIGLHGAPTGTALCYLAIGILNIIAIRRTVGQKPAIVRNLLRALIPAALMGAGAFGSWWAIVKLLGEDVSRIIQCGVPIVIAVVIYVVTVVWCKAITKEDCLLLPKGEKIAKLLHL